MAAPNEMRVWTVQPMTIWEQLQVHGLLHADETWLGAPSDVPRSYRWLVRQLEQRLPEYPGTLPWWAYCEKPDLRWVRHTRTAGHREVRLELEPCPGKFLTFPVWAWNTIYCGNYLSFARVERDEWMEAMRQSVPDEDEWPLPEPWKTQLEASWLRLFDPLLPSHPENIPDLLCRWPDMREERVLRDLLAYEWKYCGREPRFTRILREGPRDGWQLRWGKPPGG